MSKSTLQRHRNDVDNEMKLLCGDEEVTVYQLRSIIDALHLQKRGRRPYLPEVENAVQFLRNGYAADVGQGASPFETKQDALELINRLAEAEPDEQRKAHAPAKRQGHRQVVQPKQEARGSICRRAWRSGIAKLPTSASNEQQQQAHGPCVRQARGSLRRTRRARRPEDTGQPRQWCMLTMSVA